ARALTPGDTWRLAPDRLHARSGKAATTLESGYEVSCVMPVFARAHDRQRSRFGPSGIQLSASAGYLPEALTRAVSWTRTRNRSAPGCINRPVAPSRGDCLGSDAAVTAARQRPRECPAPGSRADAGDCNGPPTKDAPEVILGRRNDPIQAFAPNRANQ